ncbi:MAG: hypothetical protein U9R42_01585 [Bacteroidota bacterium]|nr:hypothetical protein [Bacteroidota bacterium]
MKDLKKLNIELLNEIELKNVFGGNPNDGSIPPDDGIDDDEGSPMQG